MAAYIVKFEGWENEIPKSAAFPDVSGPLSEYPRILADKGVTL